MREPTHDYGDRNESTRMRETPLFAAQWLAVPFIFFNLFLAGTAFTQQVDFNIEQISNVQFQFDENVENRYRQYSDIWGWEAKDSTPYAIIGCGIGTLIYDVSQPAEPQLIQIVPGSRSVWRDMKSHADYIYVVADEGNDGLLIIDMSMAPDSISWKHWKPAITANGTVAMLQKCHNLYIADGYAYLAGCNVNGGGIIVVDLHTDPLNPMLAGVGDPRYAHDVFVVGERMITSDLSNGFTIADISDKADIQSLATQLSSGAFTHNAWASDDGNLLFTTDERGFATVDAYDISNLDEITRLDRYRPLATLSDPVVPHNVHYYDSFLVISYYTDGLKIVDARSPENLIEIGSSDTYFRLSGGFDGLWGAFPYTSSRLIYGSDMATGLYIFQTNYQRAAYLQGVVSSVEDSGPLEDVAVTIVSDLPGRTTTALDGTYKTGLGAEGTFTVRFFKLGFHVKEVEVDLVSGETTDLTVELEPLKQFQISGVVVDDATGNPISLAQVAVLNDTYDERLGTGQDGRFSITSYEGEFVIAAGKWGYEHSTIIAEIDQDIADLELRLPVGYRDDFVFNYGWSVASIGEAAIPQRQWDRGQPQGYFYEGQLANPDGDIEGDFGRSCFVTGLSGSAFGNLGDTSMLYSPDFDLTGYIDPFINYHLWFFADGVNPPDDVLDVYLDNGTEEVLIARLDMSSSVWRDRSEIRVLDFLPVSNTMRLRVFAADVGEGHIYEAGFDGFSVTEGLTTATEDFDIDLSVSPNPFSDRLLIQNKSLSPGFKYRLIDVLGQLHEAGEINGEEKHIDASHWKEGIYFFVVDYYGVISRSIKLVKM
ncbi:MAG: choice-of-anchor B family protein [Saprospiraceae bacterium]|nr:choice-of-anchor B family protein [Saprospiraceae bacterium]